MNHEISYAFMKRHLCVRCSHFQRVGGDNAYVQARDGFRERGALGHLSFWGPTQVCPIWPFV